MDQKSSRILTLVLTGLYFIAALLYIIVVVRPALCFHFLQPPFLLTSDFIAIYLDYPGGLSEWLGNLVRQAFHSRFLGPLVFFLLAFLIWGLSVKLLNRIQPNSLNVFAALLPFTLSIVLLNNYNFPLSVTISLILILFILVLLSGAGKNMVSRLILFSAGVPVVFYTSGITFLLLYAIMALFFTLKQGEWRSLLSIPWVLTMVLFVYFVDDQTGLLFFMDKAYFQAYEAGLVFYIYIFSLPVLFLLAFLLSLIPKRRDVSPRGNHPLSFALVLSIVMICMAWFSHYFTFSSDARKIVLSDYYGYHGDKGRTARAAMSMENYSFAANVNYNLAISKSGTLTEDFFSFFQISGTDALHPDVAFSPEMLFIAADFYYELGYISEARHNAYEALVYYPYSPRALQLLIKIHLINGEYKAAERTLHILGKGLVSRKVVKEFQPYIEDSTLILTSAELMEKRRLIPAEKELSPFIDQRFRDLLEANPNNKLAYESLMLYYLADGQLEPFLDLYADAGKYFKESPEVYEEAILMYGMMNPDDTIYKYQVSQLTQDRFGEFGRLVKQYEGQGNMARNVLYHEMGQSYMYYLGFLYPRIVKPEFVKEEYDEAPI